MKPETRMLLFGLKKKWNFLIIAHKLIWLNFTEYTSRVDEMFCMICCSGVTDKNEL